MFRTHHWAAGTRGCGHAFSVFDHPLRGQMHKGYWGGPLRRPKYNVPINIIENDTHYEVHVYALGFAKENIKVSVTEDLLYITGTREIDEANAPNFRRQEYPIKNFERVIALNGQVDTDGVNARQQDGVLIVTLPKVSNPPKSAQEITII